MKYLLILLFFCSCGTRKTDSSKIEHTENSLNIENSYYTGSKIVLMDIFTAKPIDALKPMWIDGKKYQNAVITSDKSKKSERWFYVTKKYFITKTITIEKQKSTDKKDDANLWIGLFAVFFVAVILWLKIPSLK